MFGLGEIGLIETGSIDILKNKAKLYLNGGDTWQGEIYCSHQNVSPIFEKVIRHDCTGIYSNRAVAVNKTNFI